MSEPLTTEQVLRLALLRRQCKDGSARQIRLGSGLSMHALADACGADASAISRWEKGERGPRSRLGLRYAAVLDALVGGSVSVKETQELGDMDAESPTETEHGSLTSGRSCVCGITADSQQCARLRDGDRCEATDTVEVKGTIRAHGSRITFEFSRHDLGSALLPLGQRAAAAMPFTISNKRAALGVLIEEAFEHDVRVGNALRRAGYTTLGDLAALDETDLRCIRNFGRGSVETVRRELSRRGLSLAKVGEFATQAGVLAGGGA